MRSWMRAIAVICSFGFLAAVAEGEIRRILRDDVVKFSDDFKSPLNLNHSSPVVPNSHSRLI